MPASVTRFSVGLIEPWNVHEASSRKGIFKFSFFFLFFDFSGWKVDFFLSSVSVSFRSFLSFVHYHFIAFREDGGIHTSRSDVRKTGFAVLKLLQSRLRCALEEATKTAVQAFRVRPILAKQIGNVFYLRRLAVNVCCTHTVVRTHRRR